MPTRFFDAAALAAAAFAQPAAASEELRILEELNRKDLAGTENTEVILVRQTLMPGAYIPPHTHNGDEHAVILQGAALTTDGGKVIPFKDGMTAHFPRGKVHGGLKNDTDRPLVMINVYIVDKDKPLVNPVN